MRSLSIRAQLSLSILGITLGALALGFTLVGVRQVDSFREQRLQAMSVIAEVVGDSSVSALAFADPDDASNVLGQLAEFPDIEAAALYDADGALFATFERDATTQTPQWPDRLAAGAGEVRAVRGEVAVVRIPVVYEQDTYGTIELVASNASLDRDIRSFLVALAAIAIGLIVLSNLAGWFLQRRITRPIRELVEVARRITSGEDTSLRAATGHGGEIGTLSAGFNAMLAKLEAREREVVASRDLMRAMIDASPVAILRLDRRGTITLWSARAVGMLGVAEADALDRPIAAVIPDPAFDAIWSRAAREAILGIEVETGDRRALSVASAPLPDGGAVVMIADITAQRRAAEELAEREGHLQRAQKMEVVGRLAGGVAHDFNNLLTVVMASCQMLYVRAGQRLELKGYVDNIQIAAQRGAALSRRLLAFSKQQAVDARPIDVRTVVTELERMVRSVVSENIQVIVDLPQVASVVSCDQGQLEQVLLNMVLNARDAMPKGGALTLRARVLGLDATDPGPRPSPTGWVAVSVIDTGVGMSAETAARVFEPFFTTKEHGTGLGLATAHQIARDLGGEITLSSKPGQGSVFTLWLPRMREVEAGALKEPTGLPVSGSDTVLLVEDEPALRSLIQIMLVEAGYHVIAAATPMEALALGSAPGVVVDLLVTDVVMPEMSGPELAAELVRRRADVQVLYMSGYTGEALSQQGLDEAAALVQKPFTPEHLLKVIRDTLDARPIRRVSRASELVFGKGTDGGTA
jgi:two-component system, cell cycle sensor histidine kinase and response regulator CckA